MDEHDMRMLVDLIRERCDLQSQLDTVNATLNMTQGELATYVQFFERVAKVYGYVGHPSNLAVRIEEGKTEGARRSLKALGLDIDVWRSDIDGKIVVHIDTSDLPPGDTHDGDVPDIRVGVNDSYSGIGPDGEWDDD